MAITLYGKPVAEAIKADLKERVEALKEKNIKPKLAILRAGERMDDTAYENRVLKLCMEVGIDFQVKVTTRTVPHEIFEEHLIKLNNDPDIHGILVFRPLPEQIDEERICSMIDPSKDIDCMNSENLKKVFIGDKSRMSPCTPEAVISILKHYGYDLTGKNVAIVNRSLVLGKPLAMLFMEENSTVTVCHSRTKDLPSITREADIVVTGIGRANFFTEEYFSEKNTVVDVGINFAEDKMCGDVQFDAAAEKVEAITPVPGGVGIVTSTILLRHLVESAESRI